MLWILHADHEQNCSTGGGARRRLCAPSALRAVGSARVDPFSAVAAGVAALYGPLHGGANEAVLRTLERIGTVEEIPDCLQCVKDRKERLMGFGHRVYKNYDPRARIIRSTWTRCSRPPATTPSSRSPPSSRSALDDDYLTERKLYPNVDFYSGLIYEALQIPTGMFTVMFAIPRTPGWVAQWHEMLGDGETRIARPRQIYTGERERDYVPIEER